MAVIRSSVISVTKKEYDTSVAQQTADEAKQETIEINKTLTEVDKRVSEAQSKADESLEKAQEGFDKAEALSEKVDANTGAISTIKQTTAGLQTEVKNKAEQSTVTQLADVVASKVSNVDFESNKTQTAELISSTVSLQNNENVRYVRFSSNQNSANSGNHILELQVNDSDNKNVALNVLPAAEKGTWTNLVYVTDGVSDDNAKYATANGSVSFIIDLSKIYQTLSSLQLWMYVSAGRVYYNVKLEVSTDKKTWKVVYFKDNYTPTKKGDTVILSNAEASSQISQLADNINLKVDTGDVINQINIDPKGVIISGKKISLDGDVRVLPGFKLTAETINGGTFNGNSFIKEIDIRTNDGNLPIEIKGKSSIDDAGIIIEQKTKDTTSGGIISDSRSILNNGLTVGTALDAANGDRRIDYTKDYSQVSSSGIVTPNIVRTSDRATPYWNGTGSGDFSRTDVESLKANGISPTSTGTHFYIGAKGEVRIVDEKGNSAAGITYKPLIASQLTAGNLSLNGANSFINKAGNSTWFVDGSGNRTDITCKTVSQSSLLSLKTDIKDVSPDDALADILATDVKQYRFIGEDTAETHTTFIIDDINKTKKYNVPSQFLAEDKQGRDDGTVIGYLMLAMKAQNEQIKTLEKEKNSLNERFSKIESLLNLD
ncbi:tail fiber domain-containing protein [Brochothrix thermosphacta]|uniref:tail fiber domain-containing protein n=1 Tax=Brochothrix thermosphacta TaxID=2756 RepID=UPI0039B0A053